MFMRVVISVNGLYAPAPIPESAACYVAKLVRARFAGMLLSTAHLAEREHKPDKLCQDKSRRMQTAGWSGACRPEERGGLTDRVGETKRLQGGGPASPEITPRSQAWTARTTSSGSATARGVAEPAIQSEITVMRARNWPSASTEARMTKILVRRAGLASSGICRSSGREHH